MGTMNTIGNKSQLTTIEFNCTQKSWIPCELACTVLLISMPTVKLVLVSTAKSRIYATAGRGLFSKGGGLFSKGENCISLT